LKLARGTTLVIASHNAGKVREIRALLQPFGLTVRSAAELNLPEPGETGETFTENAVLKARAAASASGVPALADDSGLAVEALSGAPGIRSARWAGPNKDFAAAMLRVERELKATHTDNMNAKFVCVLALADPGGDVEVFEGEICGHLEFPPRGDKGFGYDPIFVANRMTKTFGQLEPKHKHAISHRARAFQKLREAQVLVR